MQSILTIEAIDQHVKEESIEKLKANYVTIHSYKMFVDCTRRSLLYRLLEHVMEFITMSLHDVLPSKPMTKIRKKLMKANRNHSPCNKCSVDIPYFKIHF